MVKTAFAPSVATWSVGYLVITGAKAFTVSTASTLVSLPDVLLTMHLNFAPLSPEVTAGVI